MNYIIKRSKNMAVLVCLLCFICFSFAACGGETGVSSDKDSIMDLTSLSAPIKYAQVYNMYQNPVDYLGRTIKVDGLYAAVLYEDRLYNNILIVDVNACCVTGFEFEGDNTEAAFEENSEIEVIGVFSSYEENGEIYYCLVPSEVRQL